MEWWRRMVKRALVTVAARVKPRKNGKGILKLHNDVQTCEYKDVQVMWEILQKTKKEMMHAPPNSKSKRSDWRVSKLLMVVESESESTPT